MAHVEVYQECCALGYLEVDAMREMRCLLEEDGVGRMEIDDVYWDFLHGWMVGSACGNKG